MKKRSRKLSVKLVLDISLIIVILSVIMCFFMYNGFTLSYEYQFKEKLLSVAKAAAMLVDVEKHEQVRAAEDMKSQAFEEVRDKLQKLQKETGVKYIYTMRKVDGKLLFAIDASEEDAAATGEEYDISVPGIDKALNGEPAVDEDFYTDEWGTFLSAYAPIKNSEGKVVAIVGVDIEAKDILNFRHTVMIMFAVVFALFVLIVTLFIFIIARRITKPINTVAERMNETAGMGGDLTQRINISTNDEIGRLSIAFNKLFDTIHGIMKKVRETTSLLSASTQELSASMEVSKEEISLISEKSEVVTAGVDEVGKLFEEMRSEIEEFSANTQEITAKSEELDTFAQNLKGSARNASDAVKDSMKSISDLAILTQESGKGIAELDLLTQSITSITDTISGIAKQTNLLALNAMIEAQRAGEAGKGFVVVAENIRNLSMNTQNSVQQIRDLVKTVIERINRIVELQQTVDPTITKTVEGSRTVETSLDDIFIQINDIAKMISQISAANEDQANGIQKVVSFSDEIFRHFAAQVEAVHSTAAATQQFNAATEQVADKSNTISRVADELEELIRNFKL